MARPHGLRGELRCRPETDYPERFLETEQVELFSDSCPPRRIVLENARFHGDVLLVKLQGIESLEQAETLRGLWVGVTREELVELDEGEYYHFQLEGLEVYDEDGLRLGRLVKVLENPAHPIYQIEGEGTSWLVPAVPEFILDTDLASARVIVRLPIYDED